MREKKRTNAKRTLFHVWRNRLQLLHGVKQTRPSICFPWLEIRAGGKNTLRRRLSQKGDKTADERRSLLNFCSLSACHSPVLLNVAAEDPGMDAASSSFQRRGAHLALVKTRCKPQIGADITRAQQVGKKTHTTSDKDLGLTLEAVRLDIRL